MTNRLSTIDNIKWIELVLSSFVHRSRQRNRWNNRLGEKINFSFSEMRMMKRNDWSDMNEQEKNTQQQQQPTKKWESTTFEIPSFEFIDIFMHFNDLTMELYHLKYPFHFNFQFMFHSNSDFPISIFAVFLAHYSLLLISILICLFHSIWDYPPMCAALSNAMQSLLIRSYSFIGSLGFPCVLFGSALSFDW